MIRTNLSAMYHQANPTRDAHVDGLELRADSKTAELRVKQQAAFWGFTPSRAAHQRHALFQAKAALGNSLRERLSQKSPEQVKGYLDRIWDEVIGQGTELHVYQVRVLRDAVNAIPVTRERTVHAASVEWHTPPAASSRAAAAAPSPTPLERKAQTPDRKAPPAPQALPAKPSAGPAESTAVQDARARLRRENDRNEALTQLKKAFTPAAVPHMKAAERMQFHERLRDLVACADHHRPELMQGRAEDKALLEDAARHILASRGLLMDSRTALYKALVVRDAGQAQRLLAALTPVEAAQALKSLHTTHPALTSA